MKKLLLTTAAAALIGIAAPAAAQSESGAKMTDRIDDLIRLPDRRLDRDAPIETAVAAGCIISQTYNTQSVDNFSVQFRIETSGGPEMFNVLVPNIKHANPSSFALASTPETLRWTRLLDTFERAAASDRPVRVSYETLSRNVFGITIEWNRRCAS